MSSRETNPNLQPPRDNYHPQAQFTSAAPDHEHSDVSIKGIFGFVVLLVVAAIAIHVVIWFMYGFMEKQAAKHDAPRHALAKQEVLPPERQAQQFPEPRLQRSEVRDMNEFRQRETQRLHQYTWIDQKAGTVSIPIDRAFEIIAERGLPAAQRAPAATPQDRQGQAKATSVPQRRVLPNEATAGSPRRP